MIVACLSSTASCEIPITVDVNKQVQQDLQGAIQALSLEGADIEATLSTLVQQLQNTIPEIQQAVANVANGIADELNTAKECAIDQIRIRVRDALAYIKVHDLEHKSQGPPPTPWACDSDPHDVRVEGNSTTGPWTLVPQGNVPGSLLIWGTNFTDATRPSVDLLDRTGKPIATQVTLALRESNYKIAISLSAIDFGDVQPGAYLRISWPGNLIEANEIPIHLVEHLMHRDHLLFPIHEYAPPSPFPDPNKNCQTFYPTAVLPTGQTVDQSQGSGGVSLVSEGDNSQAADTKQVGHQVAPDLRSVVFTVRICGASGFPLQGAGAIFDETWAVFWMSTYTILT